MVILSFGAATQLPVENVVALLPRHTDQVNLLHSFPGQITCSLCLQLTCNMEAIVASVICFPASSKSCLLNKYTPPGNATVYHNRQDTKCTRCVVISQQWCHVE